MAKCSNCGANVDGMKFCAECGTRVPQDKECPSCNARMPIAAKFCSECGYDFSSTDSGSAENDNDQIVADSADGNESAEKHASSARCSISLKSSGNDKDAVARELCSLLNRTMEEAKSIVNRTPIPLHLDIARDEAERIADVLGRVGATVELFDYDAGTQTHGNCSVVLQRIPSGMGIPDKAGLGAEIAMLLGCMPANAFRMLDDLPLTVAENVSREEADEIVNKFAKRKCVAEIVWSEAGREQRSILRVGEHKMNLERRNVSSSRKTKERENKMKYRVGFREIGSVTLGCHGKDLQWLDGVFDTREEAIRAINDDMDAALKQYQESGEVEEDSTVVDRDIWEIRGNYDDGEDFYCAWQTRDFD